MSGRTATPPHLNVVSDRMCFAVAFLSWWVPGGLNSEIGGGGRAGRGSVWGFGPKMRFSIIPPVHGLAFICFYLHVLFSVDSDVNRVLAVVGSTARGYSFELLGCGRVASLLAFAPQPLLS